MFETAILTAAAIPAAGWAAHAAFLYRQLRAERTDPLTGLTDRRTWTRRTDRMIRKGTANAVLLLDLNGFKPINDTFGHDAGDAALIATAARLTDFLEDRSTTRPALTRLGGDEFAAAFTTGDLPAVRAGLADALAQPVPWPGGPLTFTASIGTVHTTELPQPSASTALKAADTAMYEAKGRGRRGRRALRPLPRRLSALLSGRAA
ncbi:GGDEF domain-containing protein [Streptomyces sp. NPDC048389]|uniref:GGDEF domain-containing protein n=1 Tax=Streptomyces sp. NPDC048389 TaxID=3154622 RepID=UPI0034570ECB